MKKRLYFRQGALALLVGAFAASWSGFAIGDTEPNNVLSSATELSVGSTGVEVQGAMAAPSPFPDFDFYTFHGKSGQKFSFFLDDTAPFNGVLTLVTPSGKVKAEKYATVAGEEVRIEEVLNETGMWAIVVTPLRVLIGNPTGGDFASLVQGTTPRLFSPTSGPYKLVITPATPPALRIGIEIKPGSGDRAPINPKARGVVPVALLAAPDFDPFKIKVDASSLTFGRTGTEQSLRRCAAGGQDVDGDGDLDRVCTFENQAAGFVESSVTGYLKGETTDGMAFEAEGWLKVLPQDKN